MNETRKSDRWLTPGVIIAALLVVGALVASIIGSVAYLAARGIDPDPLLKLAANLIGAAGSLGTFVLMLAQRAQNSKTERNTGVLAGNTGALLGAVDELVATVPVLAATPATPPQHVASPRPPVPPTTTSYQEAGTL